MFALECASKLRECGCSSFDVEKCIQDITVGTGQHVLSYGRPTPDEQYQKEAVDIYNTSKVQYMHDIKHEGHIPPTTNV